MSMKSLLHALRMCRPPQTEIHLLDRFSHRLMPSVFGLEPWALDFEPFLPCPFGNIKRMVCGLDDKILDSALGMNPAVPVSFGTAAPRFGCHCLS